MTLTFNMENKLSKYQEMKSELDSLKKQSNAHISMAKSVREENWKLTKSYLTKHPSISKENVCVETGCVLHEIRENYLEDYQACKNYNTWLNKRSSLKHHKSMSGIYWADPKIDRGHIDRQLQEYLASGEV
tara:strand:- start:483 stop:875 length:393 start_codon:yes stop_codon:yes gene_type:complete